MIIICHYGELGLKGGNRKYFEQKQAKNIKETFQKNFPELFDSLKIISGRILVHLKNDATNHQDAIKKIMKNIFGVVHFSFAVETKQDIEAIKSDLWNLIKDKSFKTFRITAQRSNKNFPFTSQEINMEVGAFIFKKSNKSVSLKNPELNCFIEIADKWAFIYTQKHKGAGGMPVGTSSKALALLSGGIDSPVASYFIIKRGASVDFIHFHSLPYTNPASIDKVKRLAEKINLFQGQSKLFLVAFGEIQKEIMMAVPPKLRVIFYRRVMMKISEKIAEKNNYHALVTGDSLGQVASQTIENIRAVEEAVKIPVFRPLIGLDKEEIMDIARKIDTYETSILPHEDCCTRFIPQHPETKAKLEEVKLAEKNIPVSKMVKRAIKEMEVVKII